MKYPLVLTALLLTVSCQERTTQSKPFKVAKLDALLAGYKAYLREVNIKRDSVATLSFTREQDTTRLTISNRLPVSRDDTVTAHFYYREMLYLYTTGQASSDFVFVTPGKKLPEKIQKIKNSPAKIGDYIEWEFSFVDTVLVDAYPRQLLTRYGK